MRFEEAQEELEQIVQQLESGQADLDKSIRLWERGEKLHRFCVEQLESAQASTTSGSPPSSFEAQSQMPSPRVQRAIASSIGR